MQSELVWDEESQGFRLPGSKLFINWFDSAGKPLEMNILIFTSKDHNSASSRKAAFLIPAPHHSPGLYLLLGGAGGQDTSIKGKGRAAHKTVCLM